MSDLVHFEDLAFLDGKDLQAVLNEATPLQVIEALVGVSAGFRQQLLTKLSLVPATRLETQVNTHGPVPFEAVQSAQRALVDALCRLSRGGLVAFDDPEDMVA